MNVGLPRVFEECGWHLIGRYDSDVGSWLLVHNGQAMLLEVPEGLTLTDVDDALKSHGDPYLKYMTASHNHEDHLDQDVWNRLFLQYAPIALKPTSTSGRLGMITRLDLGREPLYLIDAPKHYLSDRVVVFRGVAMTGDIELGTLDSVNNEVPTGTKMASMARLYNFQYNHDYHIHTIVSAHLDDIREQVDWESLFNVHYPIPA